MSDVDKPKAFDAGLDHSKEAIEQANTPDQLISDLSNRFQHDMSEILIGLMDASETAKDKDDRENAGKLLKEFFPLESIQQNASLLLQDLPESIRGSMKGLIDLIQNPESITPEKIQSEVSSITEQVELLDNPEHILALQTAAKNYRNDTFGDFGESLGIFLDTVAEIKSTKDIDIHLARSKAEKMIDELEKDGGLLDKYIDSAKDSELVQSTWMDGFEKKFESFLDKVELGGFWGEVIRSILEALRHMPFIGKAIGEMLDKKMMPIYAEQMEDAFRREVGGHWGFLAKDDLGAVEQIKKRHTAETKDGGADFDEWFVSTYLSDKNSGFHQLKGVIGSLTENKNYYQGGENDMKGFIFYPRDFLMPRNTNFENFDTGLRDFLKENSHGDTITHETLKTKKELVRYYLDNRLAEEAEKKIQAQNKVAEKLKGDDVSFDDLRDLHGDDIDLERYKDAFVAYSGGEREKKSILQTQAGEVFEKKYHLKPSSDENIFETSQKGIYLHIQKNGKEFKIKGRFNGEEENTLKISNESYLSGIVKKIDAWKKDDGLKQITTDQSEDKTKIDEKYGGKESESFWMALGRELDAQEKSKSDILRLVPQLTSKIEELLKDKDKNAERNTLLQEIKKGKNTDINDIIKKAKHDTMKEMLRKNLVQHIIPGLEDDFEIGRLSEEEAKNLVDSNDQIGIKPGVQLEGVRQKTLDGLVALLKEFEIDGKLIITSATGGTHKTKGRTHARGFKLDISHREQGRDLENKIASDWSRTGTYRETNDAGKVIGNHPIHKKTIGEYKYKIILESDHLDIQVV